MSDRQKHIVIIGGGIAGTALAIGLSQRGIAATLVERDPHWTPLSSGIFVYCNGLHALDRLGVLYDVCASGWASPDGANDYFSADGAFLTRTIYPRMGKRIPAIVGIRRVELHRALASRVRELGVDVRLGESVTAIDDAVSGPVRVTLSSGTELACNAAIGADGIRSWTRTHLFGAIEPVYTGFGVWRSTHRKPASIDAKIMMMGVGTRLGIMPISDDELYMFGTTREPGKPHYPRERWADVMREKFAAFAGPAADLLEEIKRPEDVFYTAIEEIHLPLPWSKRRVGLIGDSAHSSSPFMGQGGAMALEDGVILADMIAGGQDMSEILCAFGERRFERCKFVQDASRRVGEAGAVEDAASIVGRKERMRKYAQRDVDDFYATMLGHDAHADERVDA